jgi:hypothetical protein
MCKCTDCVICVSECGFIQLTVASVAMRYLGKTGNGLHAFIYQSSFREPIYMISSEQHLICFHFVVRECYDLNRKESPYIYVVSEVVMLGHLESFVYPV